MRASLAAMAAVVTVRFAIGGRTFGEGDGPSFVGNETLAHEQPTPRDDAAPVPAGGRGTIPAVV